MTKAFTALTVLNLRDNGKLKLDALAEEYVPELKGWHYPTEDSQRIRVRNLLNHAAGLVTDDPWGDRHQPQPEAEFTELLKNGVVFSRAPGLAYEYSNLGYAILGRVITNVSGRPFAETIGRTLLRPLGMDSTGFVYDAAPLERRALGYRWEDHSWKPEPMLAHGSFGAMGGIQTTANDYAKWVAFLLSAWPPRDSADDGPVRRASIRELTQDLNMPSISHRYSRSGTAGCPQASAYGKGMNVKFDCELGFTVSHSGGYPGYGSHVLLLPDLRSGIFAFANRTYASPAIAVWEVAAALYQDGQLGTAAAVAVSDDLRKAYSVAGEIYASQDAEVGGDYLALNFFLDRGADTWAQVLAKLSAEVGECDMSAPLTASSARAGKFTWVCEHGRLQGRLLLAPTQPVQIQYLQLEAITL
jgi:CubicO group peptidase (beta-lactamase class C family)